MILRFSLLFFFIFQLSPAIANDGIDRYEGSVPNVFYHLYAPVSEKAGFAVLQEDMEGGADGDPSFRWAQQHVIAIIKVLAFGTYQKMGLAVQQLTIFDLTSENGDTPIQRSSKEAPYGRHPGGSHDGGVNIDLGYYMTSTKGTVLNPDYAVCDDHFSPTEKDDKGQPKDLNECKGFPNRLDTERMAYFYLLLFKLHEKEFHNLLLDEIGIDFYIKTEILKKIKQWKKEKKYGADEALIKNMEMIFTCDRFGGWARFHHHHTHIRFRNLDINGEFRRLLTEVIQKADSVEFQILSSQEGKDKIFLKAELSSYLLGRTMELRILSKPGLKFKGCEFSLEGETFEKSEYPEDLCKHYIDLPDEPVLKDKKIKILGRVETLDGKKFDVSAILHLPKKDPLLRVKVFKNLIQGEVKIEKNSGKEEFRLKLNFPELFKNFLTGAEYQIYYKDGDLIKTERIKGEESNFTATYINTAANKIISIDATVSISTRIKYTLPVYIGELKERGY